MPSFETVAALLHHLQDGADAFNRELAVVAQQLAQLGEDTLDLIDLLVGALDEDGVATGHELDAERVADFLEVAVAAAEEAHRFITTFELDS